MTWLFAVLIVVVMGAVAVVAVGRGGTMAEVYDDRRDVRVPADGPLTAADLRGVRFTTAFRGYRMSEVDTLLERVADELASRDQWCRGTRDVAGDDRGPGTGGEARDESPRARSRGDTAGDPRGDLGDVPRGESPLDGPGRAHGEEG